MATGYWPAAIPFETQDISTVVYVINKANKK